MRAIDELERLEREATRAPWIVDGSEVEHVDGEPVACAESDEDGARRHANAELIAVMRDRLPALLKVARAAELVVEFPVPTSDGEVMQWIERRNALTAALAKLREVGK